MPKIPVQSALSYLGVFFLIVGFFLVLAGIDIVRVEKLTVKPGRRTWGFGILLALLGILFLVPDITDVLRQASGPAVTVTKDTPITVTVPATDTPMLPASTPSPTDTPVLPTPIPTPTSTPTVSPVQAIRDYYSAVMERRYSETWSQVSDHYKSRLSDASYDGYVSWWDRVAQVDIRALELRDQRGDLATVFAQIFYLLQDGREIEDPYPYIQMQFDSETGIWLFYDEFKEEPH